MGRPKDLKEALEDVLTESELEELGSSFDVVGDIAVIKLSDSLLDKKGMVGEGLMEVHGNVNTVLLQTSPVEGEYRTRDLEVIAGEEKTETTHKEHGCYFKVDLDKVYFSPRLAHERQRIAQKVEDGDVVNNMFAGVGCYSIIIAKRASPEKVYSIDKNEDAVEYMKENIRINKVGETVIPIQGDAREVIQEHLLGVSDRVLMPLPEFGREFLDVAFESLKPEGGTIHFYDYGEEPELFRPSFDFVKRIAKGRYLELEEKRILRSYGPNIYHIVLDVGVGKTGK